jgi:TP901 family phage tail tape measure protein
MTQQERLSYLTRIFGAESLQEINILMAQGSDKLREYTKTLENADGAARQMADTMADNLSGSWEQFTGAIESVGIQLGAIMGAVIRPALDSMTEGIRNLGEWFNSLSPNMQAFLLSLGASIGIIVTFTAALGAILFVVTPIL